MHGERPPLLISCLQDDCLTNLSLLFLCTSVGWGSQKEGGGSTSLNARRAQTYPAPSLAFFSPVQNSRIFLGSPFSQGLSSYGREQEMAQMLARRKAEQKGNQFRKGFVFCCEFQSFPFCGDLALEPFQIFSGIKLPSSPCRVVEEHKTSHQRSMTLL